MDRAYTSALRDCVKHSTNYLYTVMSVGMEAPDPLGKPIKVIGKMARRGRK